MVGKSPSVELAAMELLEQAMEQAGDAREDFIASQVDIEGEVRQRALELLEADGNAVGSLRTGGAAHLDDKDDEHPQQIGAYRILRLLGKGGMGAVYMGERASDDFEHVVAIKLIKPGLLSDTLIERFRRERQILAQLNHPHIAHLHDGGETSDGAPYIVMEYVDGVPVTEWMEREKPDFNRRLNLFLQICDAVEFAHQNLIIHRDLTPSNVLVAEADQAKLIDFGIARPQVEDDDGVAASTFSGMSLTPGFAAPERSRGAAANTLSDVYSVGRILQVLTKEHESDELSAIATKASRDDPEDRYAAVTGLANDIRDYRAGHPVAVFSDSKRYRFRKFVARQKLAVGGSVAILLLLLAGLGGTGWAYNRAENARAEAEQRFGEVRELANFMLFDLYDELQPVTGNVKSLTKIANKSRTYLDALNSDGQANLALQIEIAQGYKRLSDVMGNPEGANLGRREEASKMLTQAVNKLDALYEDYPDHPGVVRALAETSYAHAIFKFIAEDEGEAAIAPAEYSAALYAKLTKSKNGTKRDQLMRIQSALQAAKPLVWEGRGKKGVEKIEKLRSEIDPFIVRNPNNYDAQMVQARTYSTLASTMSWHYSIEGSDYQKSIPISDKAITIYRDLIRKYPDRKNARQSLIAALFTRALIFYDLEQWQRVVNDLSDAETITKEFLEKDPDDSGMARRLQTIWSQLAPALVQVKRYKEAITMGRESLAAREKLLKGEPNNAGYFRDKTSAVMALADVMESAGRNKEGCRLYRQAAGEWKTIEKRWGVTELNRKNDIDYINTALKDC